MKKMLFLTLMVAFVYGQPEKGAPKMVADFLPGYYVPLKGDTVKGEIQINLENPAMAYQSFSFRTKPGAKANNFTTKKAKAYGFGNQHYTLVSFDPQTQVFMRVWARGRLMFYEYMEEGAKEPVFFIQEPASEDPEKKELKKLSKLHYKRELKPYMKDQPMIWNDLDKFNFVPEKIAKSIQEFNSMYAASSTE
ncbi:MAG: hypothetical protein N3F09_02380 [Bacteroidia bacterium]|nr:hypothetical protein [Bacteroidia bacterium]